jgi:hypothetical protein
MDGRRDHGVPAVPIPVALPPGDRGRTDGPGAALAQAIAALFTAGALTDVTPFLSAGGPPVSGGTLASRPVVGWVPRMRAAEEAGPAGAAPARAVRGARAGDPVRSVT